MSVWATQPCAPEIPRLAHEPQGLPQGRVPLVGLHCKGWDDKNGGRISNSSARTSGSPTTSVRLEEGFAAAGGFVRDHNDGWIMDYCRYFGNCSVLEAELWGILDGLNLILNRRFVRVLIQTDSIEAINAIQEGASGTSNSTLVKRIHLILNMVQQWRIQHISREENLVVDSLAESVRYRRLGLRLVEDPALRV
ncbi:hypothetical protein J1N35_010996 [Gossypium stocksii]|uniref:RNase H type-1 domain-containing protein n=1 Tax=Gossypium stocksii TaxID=47602 RepID=A0A9D3W2R0_9ROSI|nr:hypothetical protein J1N35_010996 [Gossypium stocksii]